VADMQEAFALVQHGREEGLRGKSDAPEVDQRAEGPPLRDHRQGTDDRGQVAEMERVALADIEVFGEEPPADLGCLPRQREVAPPQARAWLRRRIAPTRAEVAEQGDDPAEEQDAQEVKEREGVEVIGPG